MEELPDEIGFCINLRAISLKGNQLSSLPESFTNLQNLSILHLSENLFTQIPLRKYL